MTDSSKLNSQFPVHGGHGTFLASLSAMALLSITSRHHQYRSHNAMSMHRSEVLTRQTPAPVQYHLPYFKHGTRVTVQDLFGSMPVRVKQRAIVSEKQRGWGKEWEELRCDVAKLVLSWPNSVAVTIREVETNQKMIIRAPADPLSSSSKVGKVDVAKVCSILAQASFIEPDEKSLWVSVGASTPNLKMNGTISLDPSATKHAQFISFGIQPLTAIDGPSILHEEINRLFLNSAFGNEEDAEEVDDAEKRRRATDARYKSDGFTNKALKRTRKSVDRWPMFYINIEKPDGYYGIEIDDVLDNKGNNLSEIVELLQAMILEFLRKHHFRPKAGRRQVRREKTPLESPQTNDRSLPYRKVKKLLDIDTAERPSSRTSISEKKKLQADKSAIFDPLGVDVILPSFRRSISRPNSPFNEWSRIKSGITITKAVAEGGTQNPHPRPSTTSPTPRIKSRTFKGTTSATEITRPSSTPLISSNGKVLRRPFEDVAIHRAHSQSLTEQQALEPIKATRDAEEDEIITWMNPITKTESLINRRTGLTIPIHRGCSSDLSRVPGNLVASRIKLRSKLTPTAYTEPSPWLHDILKDWDNPVFPPTESSIPQVCLDGLDADMQHILHGRQHYCSQEDIDRAFKERSTGLNGRISKDALRDAEVISQVDKKFILVRLPASDTSGTMNERGSSLLVIIDQHAADERIRIESLISDLCTLPHPKNHPESGIATTILEKPIYFDISSKEITLLRTHRQHFANWGIVYTTPEPATRGKGKVANAERLTILALPPGIVERCKLDPRLLIELIRTEVWKVHDNPLAHPLPSTTSNSIVEKGDATPKWVKKIHSCPKGIIELLNSRACRSAIMFNDELSKEQCEVLVRRLAGCVFPFMCAHGRVSLVPLVDLRMGGMKNRDGEKSADRSFGTEFKRWKDSLEH